MTPYYQDAKPRQIPIDAAIAQAQPSWFTIEYRGYLICNNGTHYGFRHRDFDALGDRRYGHGESLEAAKQAIDEQIAEVSE